MEKSNYAKKANCFSVIYWRFRASRIYIGRVGGSNPSSPTLN